MIEKTIRQYLVLVWLLNFGTALSAATYVTFLMSNGLDLLEVNLVNVTFFATMFFAEIPTGAFADVAGRRKSFILSCFICSIGEFVYGFSTTILGFIIAEITVGIARTLANGAFHAWLVDSLDHHGFVGSKEEVFRKESLTKQIACILGAILGAYIGSISLSYPWFMGGALIMMTGILACCVTKEEYFKAEKTSLKNAFQNMTETMVLGARYAHKDSTVRFIIMMNIVLAFAVQPLNMYWQPYFSDSIGERSLLGFVYAGISLAILLGIHYASWYHKKMRGERTAIIGCLFIAGIGVLGAVATEKYLLLSLLLFLIHEIPRGAYIPIKDTYLNEKIPSKERATIISCQSTYLHLGSFTGLLVSGMIAKNYSINTAWVVSGLILVIVPLVVSKNGRRRPT